MHFKTRSKQNMRIKAFIGTPDTVMDYRLLVFFARYSQNGVENDVELEYYPERLECERI
jgi:hypothetical protein